MRHPAGASAWLGLVSAAMWLLHPPARAGSVDAIVSPQLVPNADRCRWYGEERRAVALRVHYDTKSRVFLVEPTETYASKATTDSIVRLARGWMVPQDRFHNLSHELFAVVPLDRTAARVPASRTSPSRKPAGGVGFPL